MLEGSTRRCCTNTSDDEWSFIETLRHLLFATDAWIGRVMLGNPSPWDPLDLPWDEMPDTPGIPRDRSARPSLDVVLALRADRMATVRQVFAELTDERLAASTEPVLEPGWPESRAFPVRQVLDTVLNEEWWHRQFAERDLDALGDAAASCSRRPPNGDAVADGRSAFAPVRGVCSELWRC